MTTHARRFRPPAHAGILRGPLRACSSLASSAGCLTKCARASLLQTYTSKTSAPNVDLFVSRSHYYFEICASRSVRWCRLSTCIREPRELPPGGTDDQRRISPLEAAFGFATVPWPTSGVTPLWGPAGERHGNKWPGCCGFVKLPGHTEPVAHHASRFFRCCPCLHRPEDHGPNLALRAVDAHQSRRPQAQKGCVAFLTPNPGDTGNKFSSVLE